MLLMRKQLLSLRLCCHTAHNTEHLHAEIVTRKQQFLKQC